MLRGANEIEVLALNLIHHGLHVREGHDPLDHIPVNHIGGNAEGKALVNHEITGVGQHRLVEPGHIAQEVVKPGAGHTARRVHINARQGLHNLCMVGDREVGGHRVPKALHLHIGRIVRANGHRGVDDLGNHHHNLTDFRRQRAFPLLQLRQPLGAVGHLLFQRFRFLQLGGVLFLFGLTHQNTHLLGQGVSLGTQVLGRLDGFPVLLVQGQHPVYQGELILLELLTDVFLDSLGVLAEKFHINHRCSPHRFGWGPAVFHVKHSGVLSRSSAIRLGCGRTPAGRKWPAHPRSWPR